MMRDFLAAAGGPLRLALGTLACTAWLAFCLALPGFIALAFGVTP